MFEPEEEEEYPQETPIGEQYENGFDEAEDFERWMDREDELQNFDR